MLTFWIIAGIILMVLELAVPGMVLVFLGAGALTVALLIWLGLIDAWVGAITTWFISSLVLLVGLRNFFYRLMPGDSEEGASTDEDAAAYGVVVEVIETIAPDSAGRISYRGTTWQAACYDETLEAGSKAKIVYRKDLIWIVEPDHGLDAPQPE
jgi:membrane protein implicated in regulation of membrane protease activity